MYCCFCHKPIADHTGGTCVRVDMWQKDKITKVKRCIFTFGLGGCTAAAVKCGDLVWIYHDPDAANVRRWLLSLDREKVVVRVPYEWVEIEGKWEQKPKDEEFADLIGSNFRVEGYSLNQSIGSDYHYNSGLYVFWKDEKWKYFNTFGQTLDF